MNTRNKYFLLIQVLLTIVVCKEVPHMKIDKTGTSISGVSSGGYMAVQYHVAHSASVAGAGIIAGGPYWCANANVGIGLTACATQPELISISELIAATTYAETLLSIDWASNLKNDRVWLFSGTKDSVLYPGVVKKLENYYQYYITNANIKTVYNIPAEHSFVTENYGNPCSIINPPYLNNCSFDSAGNLLQWIYGNLMPKTSANQSNIFTMPQQSYTPGEIPPGIVGLGEKAYIYIPGPCQNGQIQCRVHVALHGCLTSVSTIGTVFIDHSGYNEWAEANNIIILYPQTIASDVPYNPQGCWDWWGYTGLDYATKLAPQIITIKNMVDSLG